MPDPSLNRFSSVFLPLVAIACVGAFLVFFFKQGPYTNGTGTEANPCKNCNVLIIAYDALQASHVSYLGAKNETTPFLDSIARLGTSFDNNISAAPWTVPSFMSAFTDLYPSEHGVVNKFTVFTKDTKTVSNLEKISPNVQTLAEVFKANGYVTGGFTGDAGVSSQFGYNKGFDIYTDEKTFGGFANSSQHALPWIQQNKDKKLFIFLHGYDGHGQFDVGKGFAARFVPKDYSGPYTGAPKEQAQLREEGLSKGHITLTPADVAFWRGWYDSKIRNADDNVAAFWKAYSALGVKNPTVVVIMSDHGTEFYEHGRLDHGFSLYDELVHVPLVFLIPGTTARAGSRVGDQVTTLDIAPTLIDITGIQPTPQYLSQLRGKSLLSYFTKGTGTPQDVFMETDYRDYTHKRGIRTADGWKYVKTMETGAEELYNLKTDPQEKQNVLTNYPDIAPTLRNRVATHLRDMGQNVNGPWIIGCLPVYGDQCKNQ